MMEIKFNILIYDQTKTMKDNKFCHPMLFPQFYFKPTLAQFLGQYHSTFQLQLNKQIPNIPRDLLKKLAQLPMGFLSVVIQKTTKKVSIFTHLRISCNIRIHSPHVITLQTTQSLIFLQNDSEGSHNVLSNSYYIEHHYAHNLPMVH